MPRRVGHLKIYAAFAMLVLLCVGLVGLIFSASGRVIDNRFQPICQNNLKALSIALHAYRDKHGSFPPPWLTDKAGNPSHSWRVLILPELGEEALYREYDFSEPWNGPHNSRLASRMPTAFGCPDQQTWTSARRWNSTNTNYVALVGPQAAFDPARPRTWDAFQNSPSDTLMLVEVAKSDIHWMEPRDLDLRQSEFKVAHITHQHGAGKSPAAKGVHAANADGSVRFLPANTSRQEIHHLVTLPPKR